MKENNIIFIITKEDLQNEAIKRIGRQLSDEETDIAKEAFECGLQTCTIDIIYNTIFEEMIK